MNVDPSLLVNDRAFEGRPFCTQSWYYHLLAVNLFTCGLFQTGVCCSCHNSFETCRWCQIHNKQIFTKISEVVEVKVKYKHLWTGFNWLFIRNDELIICFFCFVLLTQHPDVCGIRGVVQFNLRVQYSSDWHRTWSAYHSTKTGSRLNLLAWLSQRCLSTT